jgi:hypothetical protein
MLRGMAHAPKLKVYRMAVGFHDAYVAAPSQKAAAAAWGSGTDVFARGEAELVTDPALTAEPLARPGAIVKRLRATAAEQIAALGRRPGRRQGRAKLRRRPTPRPDRPSPDRPGPHRPSLRRPKPHARAGPRSMQPKPRWRRRRRATPRRCGRSRRARPPWTANAPH